MQSGELFISYAADDPDWPTSKVREFAVALRDAGLVVHLDEFHLDHMVREPSRQEWREWMFRCLKSTDVIWCLCSPRYRGALERDESIDTGRGVAFESVRIIDQLYQRKQNNDGWIWLIYPDRPAPALCPPMLEGVCSEYSWADGGAKAKSKLLAWLAKSGRATQPVGEEESPARSGDANEGSHASPSNQLVHRHHLAHTKGLLSKAPAFWAHLAVEDIGSEDVNLVSPDAFIAWLDAADESASEATMWALTRALEKVSPRDDSRLAAERAAAALFILAACRQVAALTVGPEQIVDVPRLENASLYCAVVALVLAGGKLELVPGEAVGVPRPMFSFELEPPAGDNAAGGVLRALYAALIKEPGTVRESLKEDLSHTELSRLKMRLKKIRLGMRSSLVLYVPSHVTDSALADTRRRLALDVPVFREMAEAVLPCAAGLEPQDLVFVLQDFWSDLSAMQRDFSAETTGGHHAAGGSASDTPSSDLAQVFSALQQLVQLCQTLADRDQAQQIEKKATELATQIKTGDADKKGWIRQTLEDIKSSADALEGGQNLAAAAGNLALIVARYIG